MKKLIPFLLIFLLFPSYKCSFASASSIYAKIEQDGVYLYNSPKSEDDAKLFQLQNSYFVRLLENANDEFYYCAYKDVYGYVKKSEVVAMDGTPKTPFVEATFRIYATQGLGMYSSPSINNDNLKCTIPYLTDNLVYYGTIDGQQAIPEKSSTWIYCKYNYDASNYGFVYSVFCDKLPVITTNNERFNVISQPFQNKTTKELTSVAMGFIIVGVSLPSLIVLYLLIKPTLIKDKLLNENSKFKRARRKDYFEFDEGDLT